MLITGLSTITNINTNVQRRKTNIAQCTSNNYNSDILSFASQRNHRYGKAQKTELNQLLRGYIIMDKDIEIEKFLTKFNIEKDMKSAYKETMDNIKKDKLSLKVLKEKYNINDINNLKVSDTISCVLNDQIMHVVLPIFEDDESKINFKADYNKNTGRAYDYWLT